MLLLTPHPAPTKGADVYSRTVSAQDAAALLATAHQAASRAARQVGSTDRGYSVEDVAQDALVALLARQARGVVVANPHAYVTTAARSAAVQAGRRIRSEDLRAYRLLRARSAALAQQRGRPLTVREEGALAAEIRSTWPDPRRRPRVDFVLVVRAREVPVASFSEPVAPVEGRTPEWGSWLDRALDFTEGQAPDLRSARRLAWNAIAESRSAPLIRGPHLPQRRVTAARILFPRGAGAVEAAQKWRHGALPGPESRVLFSPWRGATPDDRQRVVDVLLSLRTVADGLWASARLAATPVR